MIGKREQELFLPDVSGSLKSTYQVGDELIVNMILSGTKSQTIEVEFAVSNNAKLKVVIFDFARHQCRVDLKVNAGLNTDVKIFVAVAAKKTDDKNYNIRVDNRQPAGQSFVKMYGTAEDKASLVFDGATKIYRGAKKSKVRQEGRIIDFSPDVHTAVSPRLLIDENDIAASHAAVLGQIPSSTLFYLRSRGLSTAEAQKLLSRGYFIPLRREIDSEVVGEIVDRLLEAL